MAYKSKKILINILNEYMIKDINTIIYEYYEYYKNIKLIKEIAGFENFIMRYPIYSIKYYKNKIWIPRYKYFKTNLLVCDLEKNESFNMEEINLEYQNCIGFFKDNIYISSYEYIYIYDDKFNYKKRLSYPKEIEEFCINNNKIYVTTIRDGLIYISHLENNKGRCCKIKYCVNTDSFCIYENKLYILNALQCEIIIYNIFDKIYNKYLENIEKVKIIKISCNFYFGRTRININDNIIYISYKNAENKYNSLIIFNMDGEEIKNINSCTDISFCNNENLIYTIIQGKLSIYEQY